MAFQLAELNIARFKQAIDDPINKGFVDNLASVNAQAESATGFVWRLVGDGDDAMDIQAFDDPNTVINLSVWENKEALVAFVYGNEDHKNIMKRRREWFARIQFNVVLWWLPKGYTPTIGEAKQRLALLEKHGPSPYAFSFAQNIAPPTHA